jgi:thiol-disulfide isomerase/thioredoxin
MNGIISIMAFLTFLIACSPGKNDKTKTTSLGAVNDHIKTGINIGDRAPEMVFPSPGGEKIALTSLRGTLVLIDFWASWCSPCRAENPNLVRIYKQFRDKMFVNGSGFTVYSVSLDRTREDWIAAIRQDGLEWESQVSDLKGWQSVPAAMYGVMFIPTNFLIDGDGVIVAKDLRGDFLENKLKELLK